MNFAENDWFIEWKKKWIYNSIHKWLIEGMYKRALFYSKYFYFILNTNLMYFILKNREIISRDFTISVRIRNASWIQLPSHLFRSHFKLCIFKDNVFIWIRCNILELFAFSGMISTETCLYFMMNSISTGRKIIFFLPPFNWIENSRQWWCWKGATLSYYRWTRAIKQLTFPVNYA